jgi:hypothetical protein
MQKSTSINVIMELQHIDNARSFLFDELLQFGSLFSFKYKLFGDYQWRRPFGMASLFHAIDIKNKLHSFDRATGGIVYS